MVYLLAPLAVLLIGGGIALMNSKRRIGQSTAEHQGRITAGVILIAIGVVPLLAAVRTY